VKDLDHSLSAGKEIRAVFEEMIKTVPKDYLEINAVCWVFYDHWLLLFTNQILIINNKLIYLSRQVRFCKF